MLPPLERRSLLRAAALGGGMLVLATAPTGCSTEEPQDAAAPDVRVGSGDRSGSVLVAYFSRAGENYYYGDRVDLEVGNTEVMARIVSRRLDTLGIRHDVHRIRAADPYPEDYDATVARNVREQDDDARPEIAGPLASIDGYDTVLLGSPIWNVRPPMIMHTFAESHDFTARTVHPFTTHAMSGLGTTAREYADACRGATIGDGLPVQGETVRETGPAAVSSWLAALDLPRAGG